MRRAAAVAIAIAILGFGCAQAPTEEMAMAQARLDAARAVGAAIFAPALLGEAEAAFDEARRLSGEERFRAAIRAAAQAVIRADEALLEATTEKRLVVRQVDRLLQEVEGLLEMASARGAATEAPEEFSGFQERYRTVKQIAEEGDLLTALEGGSALKPELLAFEKRFRDHPN